MDVKLYIDSVHVGHGDCTIITTDGDKKWSCIIDAGAAGPSVYKNMQKVIRERNIDKFDLAILSHFDNDHIGGFNRLVNDIRIDRYWSPYTPAMERYKWLFGERGERAVASAKILEKQLADLDTFLEAPTEGYVVSPINGLRIKTLSPPIKLYKALLTEKLDFNVLHDFDALLGRIIAEEDIGNEDMPREIRSMYSRYINGSIIRDIKEENETHAKIIHDDTITNPDFFGNRVLNNTSLVIKIEVWTGIQWYSLLFPGDLENWLYLLAVRPESIKADFYKASHHGGKLYISGKNDATHEVMQTIRPSITLVSANGQHNLPKAATKYAIEKWGASIFCTQTKQNESFGINGEKIICDECCHKFHKCIQKNESTSFVIHNGKISVNKQACIENLGYTNYPVVQMEQHIVLDSKILVNLSEAEINKQTKWLLKTLEHIHKDRIKDISIKSSKLITIDCIHAYSVRDDRNLTKNQIERIFEYGHSNDKLWMFNSDSYSYRSDNYVYKKASEEELEAMCDIVLKYDVLMTSISSLRKGKEAMLLEIPAIRLFQLLEEKTAFPNKIIWRYCWPQIIKRIGESFTYIIIKLKGSYNTNGRLFLVMLKRGMNFEEIKNEYFGGDKYSLAERILEGNDKLFFCSNIERNRHNEELPLSTHVLSELLKYRFNHSSIYSYGDSYEEICEWDYS